MFSAATRFRLTIVVVEAPGVREGLHLRMSSSFAIRSAAIFTAFARPPTPVHTAAEGRSA